MATPTNKILVVEDHVDTADALAWLLTRWSYTVTVVHSASAALEAAQNDSFVLVVCDLGLPDMHGYELMRKLKSGFGLKGIALTGYDANEDTSQAHAAGFVDHLVKPIDSERLRLVLNKLSPVPK